MYHDSFKQKDRIIAIVPFYSCQISCGPFLPTLAKRLPKCVTASVANAPSGYIVRGRNVNCAGTKIDILVQNILKKIRHFSVRLYTNL